MDHPRNPALKRRAAASKRQAAVGSSPARRGSVAAAAMAKPRSTAARTPSHPSLPVQPHAERKGSMEERRRAIMAETLRTLDVEIEVRRSELASLERARDVLERAIAENPDRCDKWHEESPCYGPIYARWCTSCGVTLRRCEEHGGLRAATYYIKEHRASHSNPAA